MTTNDTPTTPKPRRCEHCNGEHPNALSAANCAHTHAVQEVVRAAAARSVQPPKPAQIDDLWAHLNGIYDTDASRRAVMYVLDLGWRPTIGAAS